MKWLKDRVDCFILLLYFPIYLVAFWFIEHFGPRHIHIIECTLDHQIPFIEYFIVPYILWFAYIAVGATYFLFAEKESFRKLMYLGIFGMTVFIVVSVIYPNGLQLRPHYFVRDNIFVTLTKFIYSIDTSTNVFPSIHVFNSLVMHAAVMNSEKLKKHDNVRFVSGILCVSIILSTMFLKQHSVFDVFSAIALFCVSYEFVYNHQWEKITHTLAEPKLQKKVKFK